MSSLAMIHIAKKQLSIDEDDFRGMCRRVTGKDSTRAMSEKERTGLSLLDIGRIFGGRDHTTIMHSLRKTKGN